MGLSHIGRYCFLLKWEVLANANFFLKFWTAVCLAKNKKTTTKTHSFLFPITGTFLNRKHQAISHCSVRFITFSTFFSSFFYPKYFFHFFGYINNINANPLQSFKKVIELLPRKCDRWINVCRKRMAWRFCVESCWLCLRQLRCLCKAWHFSHKINIQKQSSNQSLYPSKLQIKFKIWILIKRKIISAITSVFGFLNKEIKWRYLL